MAVVHCGQIAMHATGIGESSFEDVGFWLAALLL